MKMNSEFDSFFNVSLQFFCKKVEFFIIMQI